ncbi:MAG: hypothetical protein AAB089_04360 [Nitrospirota bacterium]
MATLFVIPACRESFLKKDAGQAGMTELSQAWHFTYELISKRLELKPQRILDKKINLCIEFTL